MWRSTASISLLLSSWLTHKVTWKIRGCRRYSKRKLQLFVLTDPVCATSRSTTPTMASSSTASLTSWSPKTSSRYTSAHRSHNASKGSLWKLSNKSYTDEKLAQLHSDVVYAFQIDGKSFYTYILLEHQTTPDPLTFSFPAVQCSPTSRAPRTK